MKCSNFVILAKAGIHACSGKTPLEEMDSRLRGKDKDIRGKDNGLRGKDNGLRGKDNDIFVMYRRNA